MGPPSVGDVVIISFPYSDLTQSKCRPALVLAEVGSQPNTGGVVEKLRE
jgi:hypothetical protein